LIVFAGLVGWQTWAEIENPIDRPRWPETALTVLATTVGVVGAYCLVRIVWRTLRHEPPRSRKRADLWQIIQVGLMGLAFNVVLFAGVLFWGAVHTYGLYVSNKSLRIPASGFAPSVSIWDDFFGRRAVMILAAGLGLVVVAGALAYGAYRLRPRVRRAQGKCVRCGYLLTGLSEPRCPECGTAFDAGDLEVGSVDNASR
jgi:hypothetical protein